MLGYIWFLEIAASASDKNNDDTKRYNQNSVFPHVATCYNIALFIGKTKSSILAQHSVFSRPSPSPLSNGSTEA